ANLDWKATCKRYHTGVFLKAGNSRLIDDALDDRGRRLAKSARRVGFAVTAFNCVQTGALVAQHDQGQAAAVEDRYRDLESHTLAFGYCAIGNRLRHYERNVFLSDNALRDGC